MKRKITLMGKHQKERDGRKPTLAIGNRGDNFFFPNFYSERIATLSKAAQKLHFISTFTISTISETRDMQSFAVISNKEGNTPPFFTNVYWEF